MSANLPRVEADQGGRSAYAPVAVFVYNRPEHALQMLATLRQNDFASETDLFIFSDGPKNENAVEPVKKLREALHEVPGFRSSALIERPENLGCARSVTGGVSEVLQQFDRVIIAEDDLNVSPYFLRYMNEALNLYAEEEKVASVHGYVHDLEGENLPETFFDTHTNPWGWGTWRRAWKLFEADSDKLWSELKRRKLMRSFDMDGSFYNKKLLDFQRRGRVNSWAIRWNASVFLSGRLCLYPGRSLISNVGFDGSGLHCKTETDYETVLTETPIQVVRRSLEVDVHVQKRIHAHLKQIKGTFGERVLRKAKQLIQLNK